MLGSSDFGWIYPHIFFKYLDKIPGIRKTNVLRDFINSQIGGQQLFFRIFHFMSVDTVDKGFPIFFFENIAQIGGIYIECSRDFF